MPRICLRLCCFLGLILSGLVVNSLPAQTVPPGAPSGLPTIKSDVRAVLVDVVVTSGKGEPLPGLHKEDFQVSEDGKPQSITFFEEHHGAAPAPVKLPPLPPNVFSNYPTANTTDAVNVLLMDSLNTQAKDQGYLRAQVMQYLQTIQPGTRVAIFTLGARLRMVRGVSADPIQLVSALSENNTDAGTQVSHLLPSEVQRAADQQMIDLMIMNQAAPEAIAALREFQTESDSALIGARIQITLHAFQQIARYLSSFGGRKNLIWISGSFPISFFPNSGHGLQFLGDIRQAADQLTSDQVAVYPISAEGLAGYALYEAENISTSTMQPGLLQDEDSLRAGKQLAMEKLAHDTGGKAFYNTNGLHDAMTAAIDNGTHYYTLTYTPTNTKADGSYRRIQIKLVGGHGKLAHRTGYFADAPGSKRTVSQKPTGDPFLPLMNFGMPDYSQIIFKLHVRPMNPPANQPASATPPDGRKPLSNEKVTRYVLEFAVAVQDLSLQASRDGVRHGNIELILLAYDLDGHPLHLLTQKSELSLQPDIYPMLLRVGLQMHKEIEIPAGYVYLRAGIYDLISSNAGTLGIPLSVLSTAASTPTPEP